MSIQRNAVPLLARGTVAIAGVVLLAGCQAVPAAPDAAAASDATTAVATAATTADGGTGADRGDSDREDADAAVISRLLTDAFPDPASAAAVAAARTAVAPDATAHGAGSAAGPAGLLAQFTAAHSRVKDAHAVVKHIAADGDLVAVHWQITSHPDDERQGEAAVDLFRLAGGVIVEHWSLGQAVPTGTAPSGNTNTMFSDLYTPEADAQEPTEDQEDTSRVFAVTAYDTLFRDHDVSVLDRAFDPAYLQHNRVAPNGTAALESFFSGGTQLPAQESVVSLADGDLVWTFSKAVGAKADDPFLAADIFRVDDGLIREHWDVVPG